MPQLTIGRVRDLVRSLRYVVSVHAAEELEDDSLTILDLEDAETVVKVGPAGVLFIITVYVI